MQVGGDALALLFGNLLDAQLGKLGEVALDLERGLLNARLERGTARFGAAQRVGKELHQAKAHHEHQHRQRESQ